MRTEHQGTAHSGAGLLVRGKRLLYAVTPDDNDTARLLQRVEAALLGGVDLVQYRNKGAGTALRRAQAAALVELCHRHARPLIINDHVDLALELGADGVHLGGDDGDLRAARQALGAQALVGASCYASLERAQAARAAGASYIAFGAIYPSGSKPAAPPATLSVLAQARDLGLPVCAIGGISAANAATVAAAGADWLAVIGGLFGEPDVRIAAESLRHIIQGA